MALRETQITQLIPLYAFLSPHSLPFTKVFCVDPKYTDCNLRN